MNMEQKVINRVMQIIKEEQALLTKKDNLECKRIDAVVEELSTLSTLLNKLRS